MRTTPKECVRTQPGARNVAGCCVRSKPKACGCANRWKRIHRTVASAGFASRIHAGKFTDYAFFQRCILERMGRDAKPDRISGNGDTGAGGDVAAAAPPAAHHGAGGGDGRAGPDGGAASFGWSRGTEARRSELYVAGGRSNSHRFDRVGGFYAD